MLLCTVRGCHQPLAQIDRRVVCPRGHSFDIARTGYVNLLQPQDRRSKTPGDTPEAIAARRRLHDLGITLPLLAAVTDFAAPLPADRILDAGCGEGFYLGSIAKESGAAAHGIDISIPAIDAAARRYPACQWIVANADRFIPYQDSAFSLVMSITARMNPAEFHRVLRPGGRLLVAIPAPDDLIELRGHGRDRTARTIADFASYFTLSSTRRVTSTADLDTDALEDVLHAIYRPKHREPVKASHLTLSLDLLLFRPTYAESPERPAPDPATPLPPST